VYFYQHPRVALVEGGSPAERAGVLQGDTLLALNGNDVREREISLTKLLVPNHRIMVRVLRAGGLKDIPVTIGEAPGYVVGRAAPVAPMSPAPGSPRSQVRVWGNPGRPVPMPPVPPQETVPGTPPAMSSVWGFNEGVAGAKVETISEGLGRAVGVKAGVLVIRSAPGTPAFRSGLRDGDVIVRVGGRTVTTVRELRGMLERHDDDFVRLEIVRERKERDLTLRWP
jgi:S1-C subfamily serine protease